MTLKASVWPVATAPGSVFVRRYIEWQYFARAKLNQYLGFDLLDARDVYLARGS